MPHLSGVVVDSVDRIEESIVVTARVRRRDGVCPTCREVSGRVHGRYVRRLSDAPVSGQAVEIRLVVRRFRCLADECEAVTFAEQVAGLTRAHARFTPSLTRMLVSTGLAMAGRAGARLARDLGIRVDRDTLLRLVRALPERPIGQVRVLGVDDFAFRRGHRYGTILIDMDTGRPVDVLDTREGPALAKWLADHPSVEVVCRDRAGSYGEGIRQGASQAIQVADRFHLWQNLGQAVEKTITAHRADLMELAATPIRAAKKPPKIVQPPPEKKVVARHRVHYEQVQKLTAQGLSRAAIGRKLGLHTATVRKFATARSFDDVIAVCDNRSTILDDYKEYLHQRWNAGEGNAAALSREIAEFGYTGTEQQVQRYLRRFRHGLQQVRTVVKPPSVRQVTSWIMANPTHLDADSQVRLKTILSRSPQLSKVAEYVVDFATMMTQLEGHRLDEWITAVEADDLPTMASFAFHLRRDFDAIQNGLTLPYNSGPVEGHVNRLKMLKRQMFGRANLDLLRKRVLMTP